MIEKKPDIIIISPHYDDEIIGNYEIISNPEIKPIIIYMQFDDGERKGESLKLKDELDNIKIQLFQKSIPNIFLDPKNVLYFPDPIFEFHPEHRKWGSVGEELLRQGLNVIFYSINMQAPYIHEIKKNKEKEDLLNRIYPSQKSLWEMDKKYILFEGKCKWIM